MRAFHFKAAKALELRRRREEDATLALVKAQHLASSADVRLRAAQDSAVGAAQRLDEVQREGAPAWLLGWHRSWIVRKTEEADVSRRDAAVAAAKVAVAEGTLREAHKQRRVLERLQDRLAERHAREGVRLELKDMNELASTRYAAAAADRKERE